MPPLTFPLKWFLPRGEKGPWPEPRWTQLWERASGSLCPSASEGDSRSNPGSGAFADLDQLSQQRVPLFHKTLQRWSGSSHHSPLHSVYLSGSQPAGHHSFKTIGNIRYSKIIYEAAMKTILWLGSPQHGDLYQRVAALERLRTTALAPPSIS